MNSRSKLMAPSLFKTLVCIAACLPVMLGTAGSLVLCFGHGGHIAIELAHDGAHHSPDDQRDDKSSEHPRVLSHEDCNACFDIPITVEKAGQIPFKKSVSRTAGFLAHNSAQPGRLAADHTDEESTIPAYHSLLPPRNSLGELRITVLRT